MIYVVIPSRSGKLAEIEKLMAAVEQLAEAMRQALSPPTLSADFIYESGEDELTEDDANPAVSISSCIHPSLPIHLIPWYTSGFQ